MFFELGIHTKYEPPIIAIVYKNKPTDQKRRVYDIHLQKLIFHPDPQEAAKQLYLQHPHILKESKIPISKIAGAIVKIQKYLGLDESYRNEEYEEEDNEQYQAEHEQAQETSPQQPAPPKKQPIKEIPKRQFHFPTNEFDDDGPLNRSL